MAEQFQRRLPSREKPIGEIRPGDMRVSVVGTVIGSSEDSTRIVIDDGTGKIDVISDSPLSGKLNQLVRVFGRVIPLENGVEMQGEIIQDMTGLDLGLMKKVKSLKI